ncbi:unnamed protein product [Cuscuta campestris]|uniref:RNase H type-1 domain-containing protein n=1 Tax=Cuscuta campestris TaxID=132261 RepID=A0A484NPU1_9ASTE|nr:unnamed protein product [Cuscuta campestris]
MDPTNIDNGIAAISLDNEDEDGLVFGDEIGDSSIQQPAYDFCLVGRFLTERPVNFVAMKNTMASLWRPEEGMVVKEVGAGLYIFQFGALAEMERGLAFHLLWMIWSARNAKVWKGVRRSPLEVWTRTYRDYEDWWRMATPRNSTTTNLRAEPGATKGWERPPVNYLKVNVDASSGLVDRYVGLGFIVRDYEGRFVAAISIKCRGSFGPREAEAIAVKEALSWIKSKGWKQVLVETDCKEVVDSLNSTIMDWSYFNSIIEDCKRLQMLCAGDLNFCFTPRSGNEAAHLLARSSCNDDVVGEWFDTPPNFIPLIS